MLPASHGWQSWYPTWVWYIMRTKFLPKRRWIWGWFWIHVVIQYGQSRMTRTERHKASRPILKMLSVEHVRIAWWKNSEHRTLRTRLATDSRRNGKTKERTGRKNILTMDTQRATICTVNERKWYHWEWEIDGDAMGYPKTSSGFFENWIAEKCDWWTYCMRSINSHHTKKRKSSGKAVATWQWRYTLKSHESSLRYTAGLSSGQSHRVCAYNV